MKFYNKYSSVSNFFLKIRSIVINKKKPRRMMLNNNLKRYSETSIEPVSYPASFEGIILSFADRYPFKKALYAEVLSIWNEHKASLRVNVEEERVSPADQLIEEYMDLVQNDGSAPSDVADCFLEMVRSCLTHISRDPETAADIIYTIDYYSNDLIGHFADEEALEMLQNQINNTLTCDEVPEV